MFLQHSLIWNPILTLLVESALGYSLHYKHMLSFVSRLCVWQYVQSLSCLSLIKCTIILHNNKKIKLLATPCFTCHIYILNVVHFLSPSQGWFTPDSIREFTLPDSVVGYITGLWQCQTRLCTMLHHYVVVIDCHWYKKTFVLDSTLFWPICWRKNNALQCGI